VVGLLSLIVKHDTVCVRSMFVNICTVPRLQPRNGIYMTLVLCSFDVRYHLSERLGYKLRSIYTGAFVITALARGSAPWVTMMLTPWCVTGGFLLGMRS
jgi:hypothetical protein